MAKVLRSTTLPQKKQGFLKCFLESSKCRVSSIWALLDTLHRICVNCDRPAVCLDLKNLKKKQKSKEKLKTQCNCDGGWLFFFFKPIHSNIYQGNRSIFVLCVLFYILSWEHFFRVLHPKIYGFIFLYHSNGRFCTKTEHLKNNNNDR